MKLDFDIKTKGANLDFDMKDTKIINANGGIGEDIVRDIIKEEIAYLQQEIDKLTARVLILEGHHTNDTPLPPDSPTLNATLLSLSNYSLAELNSKALIDFN